MNEPSEDREDIRRPRVCPSTMFLVTRIVLLLVLLAGGMQAAVASCEELRRLAQETWNLYRNGGNPHHRLAAENYENGYRRCLAEAGSSGGGAVGGGRTSGVDRLGAALGVMEGVLGILDQMDSAQRQEQPRLQREAQARREAQRQEQLRLQRKAQARREAQRQEQLRLQRKAQARREAQRQEQLRLQRKAQARQRAELAALQEGWRRLHDEEGAGRSPDNTVLREDRGWCEDYDNILTCPKFLEDVKDFARDGGVIRAPRSNIEETEREVAKIWSQTPQPGPSGARIGTDSSAGVDDSLEAGATGTCDDTCEVVSEVLATWNETLAAEAARDRARPPTEMPKADWDEILGTGVIEETEREIAGIWSQTPQPGPSGARVSTGSDAGVDDSLEADATGTCDMCEVVADVLATQKEAARERAHPPAELYPGLSNADWDEILGIVEMQDILRSDPFVATPGPFDDGISLDDDIWFQDLVRSRDE